MAYLTELNDKNFDAFIKNGLVVVDIWAPWCGPCRMISPIIDELSVEYQGKALFGKCNADDNRDIVIKYGVRNIPTILFIKDGELVDVSHGLVQKGVLEDIINKHIDVN